MKQSFYGHLLDEDITGEQVFVKENDHYFRAILYPLDKEKFDADYESEGLFVESLQLPPRLSYQKKTDRTLSEKTAKDEKKTNKVAGLKTNTKPLQKENVSAKIVFKLVSSQLLSEGSRVHFWTSEKGVIVKVYDTFDAFKKHENQR